MRQIQRLLTLAGVAMTGFICASSMAATPASMPMKHKLECSACHKPENAVGGQVFVLPPSQVCESCHGSMEQLAKQTAPQDPHDPNPHWSHHYGPNIACTACHAEHKPSQVACNNCHDFKFKPIR